MSMTITGGAVGVQRVLADGGWEWMQRGGKPLMRGRTAGGELDNVLCLAVACLIRWVFTSVGRNSFANKRLTAK